MGQYLIDTNTAIDFLDDKLPERSKRACGRWRGRPCGHLKLLCPNVRRCKLLMLTGSPVRLLTNAQKVSVSRNKTGPAAAYRPVRLNNFRPPVPRWPLATNPSGPPVRLAVVVFILGFSFCFLWSPKLCQARKQEMKKQ